MNVGERARRHPVVVGTVAALIVFVAGVIATTAVLGHRPAKHIAVPGPERTIVIHDPAVGPAPATGSMLSDATRDGPLPVPHATEPALAPAPIITPAKGHTAPAVAGPQPAAAPALSAESTDFDREQVTSDALVSAWRANDRQTAGQVATSDTVDVLFKRTWSEGNRPLGCHRDVSGLAVCSYANGTGTLGMYVAPTDDGFVVQGLEITDSD